MMNVARVAADVATPAQAINTATTVRLRSFMCLTSPRSREIEQAAGQLFCRRHVPARVDPGAVAPDEDLGRASGARLALSLRVLQLEQVRSVKDRGRAVDLQLRPGELESHQLRSAGGRAARALENLRLAGERR